MQMCPPINYVSASPGTGKTKAAIEFMRRHIERGSRGKRPGYIFYVAPTRELLKQTILNLEKVIPKQQMLRRVRAAYSTGSVAASNIDEQVYRILDGYANDGSRTKEFPEGSIIFLTHQTFIELRDHPKFANTTVIFDEARQWVTMVDHMKLEGSAEKFFNELFDLVSLDTWGVPHKTIRVIQAVNIPEERKVKLLSGSKSARVFKELDALHRQLLKKDGVPTRMEAYAMIHGRGSSKRMIQVKLPSSPFVGFQRVFILSAAFTTSQMFHLLLREGVPLNDATEAFMDQYLEGGYKKVSETVASRHSHVVILPLMADGGMPAIGQLHNGVLIPSDEMLSVNDGVSKLQISMGDVRSALSLVRNPGTGNLSWKQKKALGLLRTKKCVTDILKWQLKKSDTIARKWFSKHGRPSKGVLFVNEDFRGYKYDTDLFEYLSHAKAEGRNDFQESNLIVFLAAVNPRPELARVLDVLLRDLDYNSDEDYVVDRAIQCLGRGNVRNHNAKDAKMLVIVPTRGLAYRIKNRMGGHPKVLDAYTEKLGNYFTWNYASSRAAKARAVDEMSPDDQRELRVYLHRARKKDETDKIAKFEKRIAQLTKGD
jgi:hypothetical protein